MFCWSVARVYSWCCVPALGQVESLDKWVQAAAFYGFMVTVATVLGITDIISMFQAEDMAFTICPECGHVIEKSPAGSD